MSFRQHLGQVLVLGLLAASWSFYTAIIVPEPYLDEVFHIRQAQAYLDGKWHVWDPKITTPPGLYIVSYIQHTLQRLVSPSALSQSSSASLRSINAVVGSILNAVLVRILLFAITSRQNGTAVSQSTRISLRAMGIVSHTVVNICLFPPLFFFTGLYYTDVLSAFFVLLTYYLHLCKQRLGVVLAGIVSLLFRQTNIFWVAIFLGGLEVVRVILRGRPEIEFPLQNASMDDTLTGSWQFGRLYDPEIDQACFEDYFRTVVSLIIAVPQHLLPILKSLQPYLVILSSFACFVCWNGGVVLGDKENHIASVHLAQMLYIWPYFMFFSLPLLFPYLLNAILHQSMLPGFFRINSVRSRLPRLAIAVPVIAVMSAIVHNNTIVHPFTLADNRHYMFYIFRLLLRHPTIRYLAVPIYFLCAWACLVAFGSKTCTTPASNAKPDTQTSSAKPNRVSFVLIWLLATAMSLCTAPLVEPRYFIVPWLVWRLHVMMESPYSTADGVLKSANGSAPDQALQPDLQMEGKLLPSGQGENQWLTAQLWLESIWFMAINVFTGYVFLYWGYEWPQEPGKVQRFMW